MLPERRQRRSTIVQEALSYQLTHIKRDEDLFAFVLVDQDGLLVASAPTTLDAEALGALCPMMIRGEESSEELRAILGDPSETTIALLSVGASDDELYLCSVGRDGLGASRAVRSAEDGVQRILRMFDEEAA